MVKLLSSVAEAVADVFPAANKVIASLKSELAQQSTISKESQAIRKRLESRSAEIETLQSKLQEVSSALTEARNENKSLSAKLAANRSAGSSAQTVESRTGAHAPKMNGTTRPGLLGSAEAAQAAQTAHLKEDLYSDLTGLLLRGVKREADADVYDCIQTGRNGSKSTSLLFSPLDYRLTHRSSAIQAHGIEQCRGEWPRWRHQLREHGIRLHTYLRQQARCRVDGSAAGLPDRGNHFCPRQRWQVLRQSQQDIDYQDRVRAGIDGRACAAFLTMKGHCFGRWSPAVV